VNKDCNIILPAHNVQIHRDSEQHGIFGRDLHLLKLTDREWPKYIPSMCMAAVVVIVSFTTSVVSEDFNSLFTLIVFKDIYCFTDLAICVGALMGEVVWLCVGALVGEEVGHRLALLSIMMAQV
jgi:hypothetical protein